ncbi:MULTISPECIES: SDR family oxidoreductase [Paenibacillus]|uniref:SDR family oxidoreductase n=1 Tax=Paenibacillus TaxID=44249 RepID=UPI0022B8F831|nr:SDR family oxidoreductase [Paenibacillus caseinilyticus]MCZ8522332.1 SDR family oxidoreductase [Paenibacillus caseinilyticus]
MKKGSKAGPAKVSGGPIALVTGASSGLGLRIAVALAVEGYLVVAAMRDTGRSDALLAAARSSGAEERIDCRELDVCDEEAVNRTVPAVMAAYGGLDVLVNNAGFAVGGYVEDIPMEAWRAQLETNFFGLVAVTRAVLPAMRQQRRGRILNISSISGRAGFPGYAPYAASKFAVEGFSEALRLEMQPYGVDVVLLEPGAYRTEIWRKGFEGIHAPEPSPYRQELEGILRYSQRAAETAPDPQEVADAVLRVLRARRPKLRYPLGKGTAMTLLGRALLPWRWYERLVRRTLR